MIEPRKGFHHIALVACLLKGLLNGSQVFFGRTLHIHFPVDGQNRTVYLADMLKLAEMLHEDPEYLATVVWENTCRLYNV